MSSFEFYELSPYVYVDIIKYLPFVNQTNYQLLNKDWRAATKEVFRQYRTLNIGNVVAYVVRPDNRNVIPLTVDGYEMCQYNHHFRGPTITIPDISIDWFLEERNLVDFLRLNTICVTETTVGKILTDITRLPPSLEHIHIESYNRRWFLNDIRRMVRQHILSFECVSEIFKNGQRPVDRVVWWKHELTFHFARFFGYVLVQKIIRPKLGL